MLLRALAPSLCQMQALPFLSLFFLPLEMAYLVILAPWFQWQSDSSLFLGRPTPPWIQARAWLQPG